VGIYKQNFDYKYSLDGDVLILNTGHGQYKFKIESAEVLENVNNIAALITKELQAVEEKQAVSRDGLSHYARLLLATLNICEKYTKLEKKYKEARSVLESIQTLKSDLKRATGPGALPPTYAPGQRVHATNLANSTVNPLHRERPLTQARPTPTPAPAAPAPHPLVTPKPPVQPASQPMVTQVPVEQNGTADTAALPTLPKSTTAASQPDEQAAPDRQHEQTQPASKETSNVASAAPTKEHAPETGRESYGATASQRNLEGGTPEQPVHVAPANAGPAPIVHRQDEKSADPVGSPVSYPAPGAVDTNSQVTATPSTAVPTASVAAAPHAAPETVADTAVNRTPSPDASLALTSRTANSEPEEDSHRATVATELPANAPSSQVIQEKLDCSDLSDSQNNPETEKSSAEQTEKPPVIQEHREYPVQAPPASNNQSEQAAERSKGDTYIAQGYLSSISHHIQSPYGEPFARDQQAESADSHEAGHWEEQDFDGFAEQLPQQAGDNDSDDYQLPLLSFLKNTSCENQVDQNRIRSDAELLEKKLGYFGIKGEVMGIHPGPVITTYEYRPDPGIKISKIVNLADDLALALSAYSIRIVAPIPGKDVMGIEIPNIQKSLVPFIDIVTSEAFTQSTSKVPICLGKDIVGNPVVVELESMPHLLIAGATGTGKSVGLNAMITSILYKATPDEVRFLMIDPKRIELSFYNDIPHLLTPVITDMNKANIALQWMVREMDRRYNLLAEYQVRHIEQFNHKLRAATTEQYDDRGDLLEPMPYIVVIIDELADLMMTASRDIEFSLTRLAQMARAAGIHLILATQRPSVDVLTGIIKANFPTRISFQVSSKTDSRTIIDSNGAETLLGNGDMLFVPPGTARLTRVHGTYVSEEELVEITSFIKKQRKPDYIFNVLTEQESDDFECSGNQDEYDEKYNEALEFVLTTRQASISGVQRALRVGYNRAARIIDLMEKNGVVGPSDGIKPRKVLSNGMNGMNGMNMM